VARLIELEQRLVSNEALATRALCQIAYMRDMHVAQRDDRPHSLIERELGMFMDRSPETERASPVFPSAKEPDRNVRGHSGVTGEMVLSHSVRVIDIFSKVLREHFGTDKVFVSVDPQAPVGADRVQGEISRPFETFDFWIDAGHHTSLVLLSNPSC